MKPKWEELHKRWQQGIIMVLVSGTVMNDEFVRFMKGYGFPPSNSGEVKYVNYANFCRTWLKWKDINHEEIRLTAYAVRELRRMGHEIGTTPF